MSDEKGEFRSIRVDFFGYRPGKIDSSSEKHPE